jgi:hypothetical protein
MSQRLTRATIFSSRSGRFSDLATEKNDFFESGTQNKVNMFADAENIWPSGFMEGQDH